MSPLAGRAGPHKGDGPCPPGKALPARVPLCSVPWLTNFGTKHANSSPAAFTATQADIDYIVYLLNVRVPSERQTLKEREAVFRRGEPLKLDLTSEEGAAASPRRGARRPSGTGRVAG